MKAKKPYLLTGILLTAALLLAGCGLLGSDDENGNEENGEEISLEDLPGTLAFSALADDGNFQIFTMKPDGTELTQITFREVEPQNENFRGFSDYELSWSADGKHIIYGGVRLAMPSGAKGIFSLYVLRNVDDPRNYIQMI